MAFWNQDDPLGIGLRDRAHQAKLEYDAQNRELGKENGQLVSFSNLGPLSDPMWDAFKQAYYEQGVDKMAGGSLPESRFGEQTPFYDATAGNPTPGMQAAGAAMRSMQRMSPVRVEGPKTTKNAGRRFITQGR